jgi:hypothetical protein
MIITVNDQCVACKCQFDDEYLENIRGNEKKEGFFVTKFPEILRIPKTNVSFIIFSLSVLNKQFFTYF